MVLLFKAFSTRSMVHSGALIRNYKFSCSRERERKKKEKKAKTTKYELVTCSSGCYVTSEFLGNWGGFESNVPGRRKLIGSEHSLPYLLLESVCRPAKAKSTQHTRSNSLLSANGLNPFERIPFVQEN